MPTLMFVFARCLWLTQFELKNDQMHLNGRTFQMKAGEVDFSKIDESSWKHRILMARSLGLNTVVVPIPPMDSNQMGQAQVTCQDHVANALGEIASLIASENMFAVLKPKCALDSHLLSRIADLMFYNGGNVLLVQINTSQLAQAQQFIKSPFAVSALDQQVSGQIPVLPYRGQLRGNAIWELQAGKQYWGDWALLEDLREQLKLCVDQKISFVITPLHGYRNQFARTQTASEESDLGSVDDGNEHTNPNDFGQKIEDEEKKVLAAKFGLIQEDGSRGKYFSKYRMIIGGRGKIPRTPKLGKIVPLSLAPRDINQTENTQIIEQTLNLFKLLMAVVPAAGTYSFAAPDYYKMFVNQKLVKQLDRMEVRVPSQRPTPSPDMQIINGQFQRENAHNHQMFLNEGDVVEILVDSYSGDLGVVSELELQPTDFAPSFYEGQLVVQQIENGKHAPEDGGLNLKIIGAKRAFVFLDGKFAGRLFDLKGPECFYVHRAGKLQILDLETDGEIKVENCEPSCWK